jgi:hypothetical protein
MKPLSAILLMFMLFFPILSAQHYQTVYSDRIAYFNNPAGNVKCIRIDSVTHENDSVFFLFNNIQQMDYDCYTPYGPSWIGEKVIVRDSMNLFFNLKNDTIQIKTNALPDESWIAYELADSTKIIARVIDFDTLSFLGLIDSVKTIGFQVYDKTMTAVDHVVNDLTIVISKNFGLVKTVNFVQFPNYKYSFQYEPLEVFDLIGLSKPAVGIQNLTWFEVFDFQPGDEIHTTYNSNIIMCSGFEESISSRTIDKYISRFNYADSIVYEIDQEHLYQETHPNDTIEYTHDTVRMVITPNPSFDKLPGEPVISDGEAYAYKMTNGTHIEKTSPTQTEKIWGTGNSCWTNCCYDGGVSWCNYYKGLGGYWSSDDNYLCIGSSQSQFVYYKKGDKTWGTPLVIADIPDADESPDIEIYPNPAIDRIWIKMTSSSLPAAFEIIDLSGKTLLQKEIDTELTPVKIGDELHGFYLYRIIKKSEIIHYGKLLVE